MEEKSLDSYIKFINKKQVCSPKYSKILYEMGIKQKSFFVWEYYVNESEDVIYLIEYFLNAKNFYSAFTIQELVTILDPRLITMHTFILNEEEIVEFCNKKSSGLINYTTYISKANAIAKMIIYLLENNLITIEEINSRIEEYKQLDISSIRKKFLEE